MDEILAALDAGERDRAFALLRDYLRRNPRDADAWLAMADAAPAPRQQMDSLRRALSIAPGHARADEIRARLAALEAPPAPVVEPLDESPVAASVAAPDPTPLSAGEMAMLESELDAPHPATVVAAEVASTTVERSYAAELAELDEVEPSAATVALDEEYVEEAEGGSGSSVWMLLVLAGALLFCVGLFLLLGDLTR